MILWIGGELNGDIADAFRVVRNQVETKLNEILSAGDYGRGLSKWAVIAMILGDARPANYKELKRYHARKKMYEARVVIDHAQFASADANGQAKLLCGALAQSLSWLETMATESIDVARLRADFLTAIGSIGWA